MFSFSISAPRKCLIYSHLIILNDPTCPYVVLDYCINRCMVELPLNNEALKHDCFSVSEKYSMKNKQFITLIIQYGVTFHSQAYNFTHLQLFKILTHTREITPYIV